MAFSSDIQAGVYDLSHVKYGNYTAGSQYYNYSYEDQGTRPYGWSWFSDQANKIDTSTRYEADGLPSNITYSKETLTHNYTSGDQFSFARQTYDTEPDPEAAYLAALATLEYVPGTSTRISPQQGYRFHDYGYDYDNNSDTHYNSYVWAVLAIFGREALTSRSCLPSIGLI